LSWFGNNRGRIAYRAKNSSLTGRVAWPFSQKIPRLKLRGEDDHLGYEMTREREMIILSMFSFYQEYQNLDIEPIYKMIKMIISPSLSIFLLMSYLPALGPSDWLALSQTGEWWPRASACAHT
jgi:hypothetical protein